MRAQTRPRERRYKPFSPPTQRFVLAGGPSYRNLFRAPGFVIVRWADRSAEDRRLRKAEAVGSNPTRSTPSTPAGSRNDRDGPLDLGAMRFLARSRRS